MNIEETVAFSIETGYGDLRPSEQKAADYILSHLEEVRDLSLGQLAKNSQVSQPTIVRMIKALGYESFKQFKYAIVEEMAQGGQPHTTELIRDYHLSPKDRVDDVPAKIVAAASSMIESSMKSISLKTYVQVIEEIQNAANIDIYGVENSHAACCDLAAKLLYLGLNCRYLTDPYLQRISAGSLTKNDAAVGISYSGASQDTVDAIKTAKNQGATTIVLTNFKDSPISQYADHLICTTQDQLFYGDAVFSRVSQTLIVDMIYMGLLTSDYRAYTQRLDKNSLLVRNKVYKEL